MSEAIDRARALIQARLTDLNAEAKKLERALASMGNKAAGRRGPAPKPAARKRRRKGARAPRGQRREQLLAAVKANPGARPAELARMIGVSANQVHGLIAKARADKLLVKKGKGYALKA
jgi:hypothetical protein